MTSSYPLPISSDKDGNDVFRMDLEGYDKAYVEEVIDTFRQDASKYRKKLVEIRMRKAMIGMLEAEKSKAPAINGVPIVVTDTGFDGTIELVLGPLN
jgi:hypothetical protein